MLLISIVVDVGALFQEYNQSAVTHRTYFHVDMDAFFVSVEELYDPSLKGKPVVVGGKGHERGVVSAASYTARKYGVHSAMPLRQAAKLCPHAIFLDGHMERYRDCSRQVRSVLQKFSPLVEMASIDEAYLDMSGTERLHGPAFQAAHLLHEQMKRETQLNCSIGIAVSRVVAKICSDQAKPNGILWIPPGCECSFLAPLDVRKIPGVGKVTETKMNSLGIRYVRDLTAMPVDRIRQEFGDWAVALSEKAQGIDAGGWYDSEIGEPEGPKSVSHEHTFGCDTNDQQEIEGMLAYMSEKVCRRLREQDLQASRVQLKLRYSDFTTFTRSRTLDHPTQLDTKVYSTVRELFRANWTRGAVRLIGVQTAMFEQEVQMDLILDERQEKVRQALNAADGLRDRFGERAISFGAGMNSRFRERTHENPAGLRDEKPKK